MRTHISPQYQRLAQSSTRTHMTQYEDTYITQGITSISTSRTKQYEDTYNVVRGHIYNTTYHLNINVSLQMRQKAILQSVQRGRFSLYIYIHIHRGFVFICMSMSCLRCEPRTLTYICKKKLYIYVHRTLIYICKQNLYIYVYGTLIYI